MPNELSKSKDEKNSFFQTNIYFLILVILAMLTLSFLSGAPKAFMSIWSLMYIIILPIFLSLSIYKISWAYVFSVLVVILVWIWAFFILKPTINPSSWSEGVSFGLSLFTMGALILSAILAPIIFLLGKLYYYLKSSGRKVYSIILIVIPYILVIIGAIISLFLIVV